MTSGRCGAEGLGRGLKQDKVRAEHENELTELIEREPFIQEREKRRKG
jgi:hypothetical protein